MAGLLCLWRYHVVWVSTVLAAILLSRNPVLPIFAWGLALGLVCRYRSWLRFSWRFCWAVRGFRTIKIEGVRIHHAPGLESCLNLTLIAEMAQTALDEQSLLFGFRIRKLTIFIFPTMNDVSAVRGSPAGGFALASNVVVVGGNGPLREMITHEIAHLFGGRLNRQPTDLLSEGLATWMADTMWGVDVDGVARYCFKKKQVEINSLVNGALFNDHKTRGIAYGLAGSFTGYLVKRFGWQQYKRLYRKAQRGWLKKTFNKVLGVSLEATLDRWRSCLLAEPSKMARRLMSGKALPHQR